MSEKERLVELLRNSIRYDTMKKEEWIASGKIGEQPNVFANIADFLLDSGVTLAVQQ